MPLIWIYSNEKSPGKKSLEKLSLEVTDTLNITKHHCWVMWMALESENFFVPHWNNGFENNSSPIITVHCKSMYSIVQIHKMIETIKSNVTHLIDCDPNEIFIGIHSYNSSHIYVRGSIWKEELKPAVNF